MTAEEYQEYLNSSHWKEVSAQCREEYDNRCAICGSTEKLNVHHWTYERLGEEYPEDLVCLCQACHERVHRVMEDLKSEVIDFCDIVEEDINDRWSGAMYNWKEHTIAEAGLRMLDGNRTKHQAKLMGHLADVLRAELLPWIRRAKPWPKGDNGCLNYNQIIKSQREKEKNKQWQTNLQ